MRVFQVWAGPRRSSAAKAVTSFITEAGFIGTSAWVARTGWVPSTGWIQTATAASGMPALSSARRTPGGRVERAALVQVDASKALTSRPRCKRYLMDNVTFLIESRWMTR